MIFESVHDVVLDDVFLRLTEFVSGIDVVLKLEGVNPAGSVKLKPAVELIASRERSGELRPGGRIIESSSGNLGIALAVICAAKGYSLEVVTDPQASREAVRAMCSLGAEVVEVTERDRHGGFLQTRIQYILRRISDDASLVWPNQYENRANITAHRDTTARSLHKNLGDIDALFVGVGTAGTLMGCVEYFRENCARTRIFAVDSVGSVTFGDAAGPRHIPGLGSSVRPAIFRDDGKLTKIRVPEVETVATCRQVARRYGLLAGGSTGTVLAAVARAAGALPAGARVAAISPDFGDKYLDTVYSDAWTAANLPTDLRMAN